MTQIKFSLSGVKSEAGILNTKTYSTVSGLTQTNKVLLYFYPKDNTPGCTNQATDFSRLKNEFLDLGITVVGCSSDSIGSHEKFINKYNLNILLLSDPEKELINTMDVWGEKTNYGKKYFGLIRSTFLIETKTEKVLESWKNVRAKGHGDRILKLLQN